MQEKNFKHLCKVNKENGELSLNYEEIQKILEARVDELNYNKFGILHLFKWSILTFFASLIIFFLISWLEKIITGNSFSSWSEEYALLIIILFTFFGSFWASLKERQENLKFIFAKIIHTSMETPRLVKGLLSEELSEMEYNNLLSNEKYLDRKISLSGSSGGFEILLRHLNSSDK